MINFTKDLLTVGELIEALSQFNPDLQITVATSGDKTDGYYDICRVEHDEVEGFVEDETDSLILFLGNESI